ncbi:MAG: truA [Francisellaceae bacterium]|nr:truA [Francisellaceae bacterium]
MARIVLGLEYDGSKSHGWQSQKEVSSIQEHLEKALSLVASEPIKVICAGRTDKGVHATSQIVHFDTTMSRSPAAWLYGTNTHLPKFIRVLWSQPTVWDFNARKKAISRFYRYLIYNHPIRPSLFRSQVTWVYRHLNERIMQEAAGHWLGTHDFSSFRAAFCQSKTPIRTIHTINIKRCEDFVIIDFHANAFLHHMVRNMVGVLISIGTNKKPISWAKSVLEARDRKQGGVTAPPQGLYLSGVKYPDEYNLPESINHKLWFLPYL